MTKLYEAVLGLFDKADVVDMTKLRNPAKIDIVINGIATIKCYYREDGAWVEFYSTTSTSSVGCPIADTIKIEQVAGSSSTSSFSILQQPQNMLPIGAIPHPLTGVIKYSGGLVYRPKQILEFMNLHAVNSERIQTTQSNTTPAVTHGNVIPSNPLGCKTGSIVGTSGSAQRNYTVPADTAWYVVSFIAYAPTTATGAKAQMSCGFVGGDNRNFTYDFDNPLIASTNVYVPSGVGDVRSVQVDDIGGGFRRFHLTLKNDGRTTMYVQHAGAADTNKTTYSGFQIVRIPDDGRSLRIDAYAPVGQQAKPFSGYGKSGLYYGKQNRFPFSKVAIFSDSIWGSGAGTAGAGSWRLADSVLEYFGRAELNVYGGNTTNQVCGYFDAQNVSSYFAKHLVIFNCGRNDVATLATQEGREATLARLKQSITALGHDHYKVCGVLARFAATSAAGQEENTSVNSATYHAILAYNAMLLSAFGDDKFIDMQTISVNSYNPLDTNDAAAFALGMRPPSIAPLTGDGLHPDPLESMVLGRAVVDSIRSEYGA